MTYNKAVAQLPQEAMWSCSFGYPGILGYSEIWRTADGCRWFIKHAETIDQWHVERIDDGGTYAARVN